MKQFLTAALLCTALFAQSDDMCVPLDVFDAKFKYINSTQLFGTVAAWCNNGNKCECQAGDKPKTAMDAISTAKQNVAVSKINQLPVSQPEISIESLSAIEDVISIMQKQVNSADESNIKIVTQHLSLLITAGVDTANKADKSVILDDLKVYPFRTPNERSDMLIGMKDALSGYTNFKKIN